MNFHDVQFLDSIYRLSKLPAPELPEIAFAGRSNVGKSSLINRLINRKGLVKVSSSPGKTQALNFFIADQSLYLVDLPGYGYAKVPKDLRAGWSKLITGYLETREVLRVVVVILDIRHSLKSHDLELVAWLRSKGIPFLPVYNKVDKLSGNERARQAADLDKSLVIAKENRVLFSATTGYGKDELLYSLDSFMRE